MTNSIARGFTDLLRFHGRDSRSEFWPYAGTVFALYMGLGPLVVAPFFAQIVARPTDFVRAVQPFLIASLLMFLLQVMLLAAAISRRLHDSGRSALWGLIPLPFVTFSAAMFFQIFAKFQAGAPDLRLFFSVFASNILYIAAIGLLIILLVLPGSPRGDRFR